MKPEDPVISPERVDRLMQASDWLLRLQDPNRSETDYDEWLRWCDADPQNFAAFETVQRRWQALDGLKHEPHRVSSTGPNFRSLSRSTRTALAIAAGVAALALSLMYFEREPVGPPASVQQQLSATLTNRAATLPDGSRMILGKESVVNMDFNGATRQLDLSSGEAYFKVKHDRKRPFVVRAGEVSVTAIGTAFDIRFDDDDVTVTVEEGTVEVRSESPGKQPAVWRAEAGHQLTYSTEHRSASIASVNLWVALSWRSGELAYLYEPLGSVVEDLNRYSTRRIRIADPEVAGIPFTGTAFAESLDGWLAAVEQAYAVEATESASGEIVLRSRDER